MSSFSLIRASAPRFLLAATLVSMTSAYSIAGELDKFHRIGLTAQDGQSATPGKEVRVGTNRAQGPTNRSGPLLRCWNYGRLVYESPVSGFVAASPNGNVVTIPGNPQKQILDMRNGMCVIE